MPRITLLLLTGMVIAQLQLPGCPNTADTGGDTPSERLEIQTLASASRSARVGETVTLTAEATGPEDGGAITYSWLQIGGYGVSIRDANAAVAGFTAPSLSAEQTLRFLVTTTNELGDFGSAEASTVVRADPNYRAPTFGFGGGGGGSGFGSNRPRADAGADLTVQTGSVATLNGSSSSGQELTFRWLQTSGTSVVLSSSEQAVVTFTAPALADNNTELRLEFELQVTDNQRRTSTDRIVVTVNTSGGQTQSPRVRLTTSFGAFTVELDRQRAPISVDNFLRYVDDGFYTNTIFHRVIPNFVVQGGGFGPGLTPKDPRDPIQIESDNGLRNERGTIAMARTNDPNSATSQFYVNLIDNTSLDRSATNPGYTVFGRVIDGLEVIDRIAQVQTGSRSGFQDVPVEDVLLRSAVRVTR